MTLNFMSPCYPVHAFPVTAREAIIELSENVKAPLDLVALSVLSAMATVSQSQVKILLPIGGQPKPVSLFTLVVAQSGDRKTTIDNLVFRKIREHDDLIQKIFVEELETYQCEHRIWKAKERKLLRLAIKDDAIQSRKLELEDHYRNEPVEPRLRRLVRQNASERAVMDALAGSGESFALLADEGGVILRSPLFRNGAFLNKVWDGGPVILDRAHGVSLSVKDPRVTTSIMVQPLVLREYIREQGGALRGSGFFARFLMSESQSLQGTRIIFDSDFCWPKLEKFHQTMDELLARKNSIDQFIEFDDDAKSEWFKFVNMIERGICPDGVFSEISDFASKVGEITARVAAVFHYFGNQEGKISTDTLKRAIDVLNFHIAEFRKAFDTRMQIPEEHQDAYSIEKCLQRKYKMNGTWIFLRNYVLRNGPVRGKSRFDAAIEILISRGEVWSSIGHDKKRYIVLNLHLNPIPNPLISELWGSDGL